MCMCAPMLVSCHVCKFWEALSVYLESDQSMFSSTSLYRFFRTLHYVVVLESKQLIFVLYLYTQSSNLENHSGSVCSMLQHATRVSCGMLRQENDFQYATLSFVLQGEPSRFPSFFPKNCFAWPDRLPLPMDPNKTNSIPQPRFTTRNRSKRTLPPLPSQRWFYLFQTQARDLLLNPKALRSHRCLPRWPTLTSVPRSGDVQVTQTLMVG